MKKYILGFLKCIISKNISIFSLIDNVSRIDKKAKINYGVKLFNSSINSYSYIGPYSQIVCSEIGKFCSIADRCSIGLANHSINFLSTSPLFTSKINGTGYSWSDKNFFNEYRKVIVGNDVWIGTRVIIMGGVKIGDGAVIGSGSIVTKDIPAYAVAVGTPAKVIRYRFEDELISKLIEIKWWDRDEEVLKKQIKLFQKTELNLDEINNLQ